MKKRPSSLVPRPSSLVMLVTCPNCSSSLQIDESKATTDRFTIRCPKCQSSVPVQLNNNGSNEAAASAPPINRSWETPPAAPYKGASKHPDESGNLPKNNELMQMLAAVLQNQQTPHKAHAPVYHHTHKRALLCLSEEKNQTAAHLLDDAGYTVFIAESPAQATEKIRDDDADVIVFSSDFALKYGGATVLQQILNSLPAAERRKIFVVSIDDNSQTYNTHEAFLRNINLIVNSGDLHHIPSILHRALREYNELYRYFNEALHAGV